MNTAPAPTRTPSAIILAAGKGTRMAGAPGGADLPKVMHEVAGRPMVHWVTDAVHAAVGTDSSEPTIVVVVGHGAELVKQSFSSIGYPVEFVMQSPQHGTGHAVDQARGLFDAGRLAPECFVLCGDGPLIRPVTLRTLLTTHRARKSSATLATSVISDPEGYGRIVRDAAGGLDRIVEQKDASDTERTIREVNPSYYAFDTSALFDSLTRLDNKNASREYYITDVFTLLKRANRTVSVVDAVPPEDVLSINTPAQLAEVDRILRARLGSRPRTTAEARP